MPESQQELAELVALLDELGARVDALVGDGADDPAGSLVGSGPHAGRAVHAARAQLAIRQSRPMGAGLEEVRERARRLAERTRRSSAAARDARERPEGEETERDEAPTTEPWMALERAGRGLVAARIDDHDDVLQRTVTAARTAVPAARWAALVACGADGRVLYEAGDGELGRLTDAERAAGDGPCQRTLRDSAVTAVADVRGDARWPTVLTRAGALGMASLLVVPVTGSRDNGAVPGGTPRALVLGASLPFGPTATHAACLVAVQAAILLAGAHRVRGLRRALDSRDVIGQAKGIVMHRDGVDAEQAFRVLVEASQHANLKLHAVATWLVEEVRCHGDVPTP